MPFGRNAKIQKHSLKRFLKKDSEAHKNESLEIHVKDVWG